MLKVVGKGNVSWGLKVPVPLVCSFLYQEYKKVLPMDYLVGSWTFPTPFMEVVRHVSYRTPQGPSVAPVPDRP